MSENAAINQWLRELVAGQVSPADLFPRLARHLTHLYLPGSRGEEGALLVIKQGSQRLGVASTDRQGASALLREPGTEVRELAALGLLQSFIRAGVDGLVLNPGSDQVALDSRFLRLLFREYALVEGVRQGGAWVPTHEGSLLAMEIQHGVYTVPVYLSEADAQAQEQKLGGRATFHPWSSIRQRCQDTGADVAYLQLGFAEQVGLPRRQLAELAGDGPDPLDRLEDEVRTSGGIANASAIYKALSALERVWTIVDQEGDLVSLGPLVDLFTSSAYAEAFIKGVKQEKPGLGAIHPHYLPARGLFRALAEVQPPVGINRGSAESWIGMRDTIPSVLRLVEGA